MTFSLSLFKQILLMIMKELLQVFITIFIVSMFCVSNVNAQHQISGKLTDNETNAPLTGATVYIKNTNKGTTTDNAGEFIIKNIRKDKVDIVITFIGYQKKIISHDFTEKENPIFNIQLAHSSEKLDEVKIQGKTKGQVKAMLIQKRAANIKNVISSEQIQQFPDMNAAEAMARIPGITLQRDQGEGRYVQLRGTPPELTNFNINGEQIPSPEGDFRYVGMDIVSADQIDMIEVTKVLTPDMDADGIAGNVNIITKKAEENEPNINISSSGGYNNLRKTDNYQLQFTFSQRHKNFGFNCNANYYQNNFGSDNMEFKYEKGPFRSIESQQAGADNYHIQYRNVQLRHYDITRERFGLSTTLDYEFNKNHYLYLRGMYNAFTDDEIRRRKTYDLDDASSISSYLYGDIEHDIKSRIKNQQVSSINLGSKHNFYFMSIDYEVAYSVARDDIPNMMETKFENPGQFIHIKFDRSETDWPRAYFPNTTPSVDALDYDNYKFDKLLFEDAKVDDENITSKINFKIPYEFGINKGFFKFGGKVRFKEKSRNVTTESYADYNGRSLIYPLRGPELTLGEVKGNFEDNNLLDKGYTIDYMPSVKKMNEFYTLHQQLFIYGDDGITESLIHSYGEDYEAEENIYATYGMIKHNIDKLMILGGVRYERADVDYKGNEIFLMPSGYFDSLASTSDQRRHEFFLPQCQVKYNISNDFNIRGALTYTYSRPNFRDVLPYREVNYDDEEINYGNPEIKYPLSMNIDLLAEKYLQRNGIISGGAFYKKIDHFIFYYKINGHEVYGDYVDSESKYEFTIPQNGLEAFVYGAELQTQFKFTFLPGFMKNLGLFTNYTYTHSEAYINQRFSANDHSHTITFGEDYQVYFDSDKKEKLSLPGQATNTFNFAFFYDHKMFYIKLSANYHDAFLYQVGSDKDLDEYYDKALRFDLTANFNIVDNLKVFTDIINLTNTPLKYYLGTPDLVKQQEYYSWWGRIGVKYNF